MKLAKKRVNNMIKEKTLIKLKKLIKIMYIKINFNDKICIMEFKYKIIFLKLNLY